MESKGLGEREPQPTEATLKLRLHFDDEDGPLEIVAHGSKRDMAFLETRIGYWQRLDDQFGKKQPTEAQIEQHPDDAAVDRFAAAMKAKLAEKRAEGRGGWDDPAQCSTGFLARLLREHVEKGDPLDVGNFAMMLWNRGGATNEMRAALAAKEKS